MKLVTFLGGLRPHRPSSSIQNQARFQNKALSTTSYPCQLAQHVCGQVFACLQFGSSLPCARALLSVSPYRQVRGRVCSWTRMKEGGKGQS